LSNTETQNIDNFDGGSAASSGPIEFIGGSSEFATDPLGGATAGFDTLYTNIALTYSDIDRVKATFERFNDPSEIRFIKEALTVTKQSQTLNKLDLVDFFHPLQDFSEYQKQSMIIGPRSSVNIDAGSFYGTTGEVSMFIAKANYLPEAEDNDRILFWDYKANVRNIMGSIMILTGAVKDGSQWRGWDMDPFSTYGHTGNANSSQGGFIFTNPTDYSVNLTVIAAN
jgi:hypothetical protein